MADELNDIQNTVHEYRKSLESFERRTGAKAVEVEQRGSGEEREKIARIDADLDAAERLIQLRAAVAAQRKADAEFETRAPSKAVLDTDSKEYAQRWVKALASGNPMEMRVLTTGTSGAAIPTDLERRIVNKLQQSNVLRSMATVSTIDSKRTIAVEGSLPTTSLVAENGAISAADPSFATAISVVPRKLVTAVTMTQEFIEDAIGNGGIGSGLDYVADKCGLSMGLKEEEFFTTGVAASSQPEGIATAVITQVTDLSGGAITAVTGDNLIDTAHLVAPQYRASPRFSWFFSDTFLKTVRKIKVNTTDYVWKVGNEGGIANGVPGTVYGIPYRIGQYVPSATANGNVYAVVGDFQYFEIFDRTGMTSMLDPYTGAANQRTTLYITRRVDSKVMLESAFAAITC